MATNNTVVGTAGIRIIPQVSNSDISQSARDFKSKMESQLNSGGALTGPGVNTSQASEQGKEYGGSFSEGAKSSEAGSEVGAAVGTEVAASGSGAGSKFGKLFVSSIIAEKLGGIIVNSVEDGLDIESGNTTIQAALGLTPEQAKKAGESAAEVYSDAYGDSLESVQQATEAVLQAFPKLKNASSGAIGDTTKEVLGLSDALGVDVPSALTAVSQLIREGFAKDTTDAFDKLSKLIQDSPESIRGSITDAIQKFGPYAQSLGLSGAQFLSLIDTAAKNGAKGLTSLGRVFASTEATASKATASTLAAYKTLGLNGQQITEELAEGGPTAGKAIGEIASNLLKVTDPAKRAQLATELFGTSVSNLGATGLPKFLETLAGTNNSLGTTQGNMAKINKTLHDTDKDTLVSLQRQIKDTFGEAMIPVLKAILPLLKDFASFLKQNKTLVGDLAVPVLLLSAGLFGLSAIFNAISIVAPVFSGGIDLIATSFAALDVAALPVILVVLAIIAAIGLVILILKLFGLSWKQVFQFLIDMVFVFVDAFIIGINIIITAINGLLILLQAPFAAISGVMSAIGGNGFTFNVYTIPLIPLPTIPTLGNGGMIPATNGGIAAILGEAGNNEVVQNEGVYNANSKAQTDLINSVNTHLTNSDKTSNMDVKIYAQNMPAPTIAKVLLNQSKLTNGI